MNLELKPEEVGAIIGALVTTKFYSRLNPKEAGAIAEIGDPLLKRCMALLPPEALDAVKQHVETLSPGLLPVI